MSRKDHDNSTKYKEKDPNIKFRRCKNCSKVKIVEELETISLCSPCYTKVKGRKRCNRCNKRKLLKHFQKGVNTEIATKDGYLNQCKKCINEYKRKYLEENREEVYKKHKEWRDKNKKMA